MVRRAKSKGYSHATEGPNVWNLRILDKASAPFVDSQADSVAFIHILELEGTQHYRKGS